MLIDGIELDNPYEIFSQSLLDWLLIGHCLVAAWWTLGFEGINALTDIATAP